MALWNSKGKRGLFELEIRRHWGILMIGINESSRWGERLDLEFPQGTDKSEFLENAYFMDLIFNSSKIKHELTRLLSMTTTGAGYKTSIHQSGNVGCK